MPPIPPDVDCNSSGEMVTATSSADTTGVPKVVNAGSPNGANCWRDELSPVPPHHQNEPMISDDESGNILERDYTGMFEGPEKTLEVVFRRVIDEHTDFSMGEVLPQLMMDSTALAAASARGTDDVSHNGTSNADVAASKHIPRYGLRRLARADIDDVCRRARCTILSCISNQYLDAYVLSESSLFVYPYMLVLKTCGTTTLLRCIAVLIDLGRKVGLEIDWVGYSRKNFNYPGDQAFPHQSFHQELEYLYGHRNLSERLDGSGYTLGPVTGDHWFVFVADQTVRAKALELDSDRVLNIMMFDIDESVAQLFYYEQYERNVPGESKADETRRISKEQTIASGINALCPGAIIDASAFAPCGYSMNAILFRSYSTIHITPESGSSYASFETNQKVGSYKALISNVIRTFRPKRFVMTLMADEGGLKQIKENPLTDSAAEAKIVVPATRPMADTTNSDAMAAVAAKRMSMPAQHMHGGVSDSSSAKTAVTTTTNSLVYKRSSLASIKVEEDCCCMMGNWVLAPLAPLAEIMRTEKKRGMSMS